MRSVLLAAFTAFVLGGVGSDTARAASGQDTPRAQRPNILFILADDLGWRDVGCYGSTFHRTPHIDALAKQGMTFTQAYAANPLCSPTRASIMTGLWPARIGITSAVCHVPEELLDELLEPLAPPATKALAARSATRLKQDYFNLAEALKEAGYATGHFGKWHLGPEPFDPLHQGFQVDVPHWSGPGPAGSYVAPWHFPPKLNFQGRPGEHVEDRMALEAVKFLKANKDRPFFLNYWAFSVHAPWDAKQELVEKYRGRMDRNDPQHNPLYAAMIESLDDAVGTLMKTLDDLGLANHTIVVFFSDNGGVDWYQPEWKKQFGMDSPPTSNLPLRGGKATIYEGGTREPCMVVWPGVTPAAARSDAVVQSVDFYPTLLEMAGLKPRRGQKFDGMSIVPALRGKPLLREAIFCHFPHYIKATGAVPAVYVRQGDWKLIRDFCDNDDQSDRFQLYNLKDDLGEAHNLAEKMPGKVKELNALIGKFLKDSGAVVPQPNPAYRKSEGAVSKAKGPPKELAVDLGGGVKLQMVLVPAGSFMMGGENEGPVHKVNISKPFYLGKYEVTQQQWEVVMGSHHSYFKGPQNPVEQVSWEDCQQFLKRLNEKLGEGKWQLPSEAQWEYACRAGSTTKYCFGDDVSGLGEYAWYGKNSGNRMHPAGGKKPNAWGLYDMHGSVWEWCADWFDSAYYANSPADDPRGPATGRYRVLRGGSWASPAWRCRSADRLINVPDGSDCDMGLRVCCDVPAE